MKRVLSFDMGTRNLAFALVEWNPPQQYIIQRLGVIDLGDHVARLATDRLVDSLMDENAWMACTGHDVVVEMQPGSSGICKILSYVLQTFFFVADRLSKLPARDFRFMQAKQKFKVNPQLWAARNPQSYAERKRLAVEMARLILAKNDGKYLGFFDLLTPKNKTDVGDALVQACEYLREKYE